MNPSRITSLIIIVLMIAGFGAYNAAFVLTEGQQALITQFGRIIGEPVTKAGLHFKVPFVQDIRMFEKRILSWDGEENPDGITTKDKKLVIVDTTARWRIVDLVQFAKRVRNEQIARSRLDTVIDGRTKDVISSHNLVEAVRNSNSILDTLEERRKEVAAGGDLDEEIVGEIETIEVGRERLSDMIRESAEAELAALGIELIDVQLRGIAYNEEVKAKVYDRMISERQRIAEKFRSFGKGEQAKITGKLNRDLKEIESLAYKESEEIRGNAEAKSFKIYADEMGKDPQFFKFYRTLDAYKNTLSKNGEFLLSTDSDFLKLLRRQ